MQLFNLMHRDPRSLQSKLNSCESRIIQLVSSMEKRKLELEVSEVVEAHDSATVHGIMAEVSQ